MVISEKIKM